ncbi:MAG: RnfABCDGE type electron transport complex subunit G [Lachnospiraceae bacterium]|nr:RnfABCDGE type electron transport complex subunit G [Lachnospiraceae bacterium]
MNPALNISAGPHVRDRRSTASVMLCVILALMPATIAGVWFHGLKALYVVLASVITCVLSEFVFDVIVKKPNTILDGSAVVTGLLLALSLSASVPLYIPIIGGIFAIVVVKCCFGGLGKNFVNPALAARCFLLISFGRVMTVYEVDGVSAATPVADLLAGKSVDIIKLLIGNNCGVIGSSILGLALGGLFLWIFDIIHGQICFSVIIAFLLFVGLFGGQGFDPGFLAANLFGGGVIMGAFFMATDYTTSPVSRLGQTIYGVLIGVLGGVFRLFGTSADSFSYSVIIANLFTPLIDMYILPKPFAYRKSAIAAMNGVEKKPLLKRIPKPVVVLTVITLLAGLALSGVYSMTKDSIEAQEKAAATAAYKAVCPDAETFEETEDVKAAIEALAGGVYGSSFGRCYINEAYEAKDASGNTAGYVVNVTTADGNDENISLAVGVKADGTVNCISFTELNETPGMGMRCGEPEFMSHFENKAVKEFKLLKGGGASADDEIDAISGATVTSSAVVNAVNAGLDFIHSVMMEG